MAVVEEKIGGSNNIGILENRAFFDWTKNSLLVGHSFAHCYQHVLAGHLARQTNTLVPIQRLFSYADCFDLAATTYRMNDQVLTFLLLSVDRDSSHKGPIDLVRRNQ